MSEKARSRNEQIAEMLRNGEKLKNFYRFTAQNPHIELHDACQIVLAHPKASICFYIDEWNELGRRVTQGRKGIMFYDADGNKQYVYDLHDTHGDRRYRRLTYPMRRLLYGLDELNGTELAASNRRDYSKVLSGVAKYLDENGYFTEDERRNSLIAEGVAYSLYSKTGFPKDNNISLRGMAYGLNENARLFKEIYFLTETAKEDINAAYERRIRTPQVIEDIDEDVISDEPTFQDESEETSRESVEPKNTVNIEAPAPPLAVISEEEKTADNPMYRRYMEVQRKDPEAVVLNRVGDFYEVFGEYAKEVSGWLDLTLTGRDVGLAERVPMCGFPFYAADTYIEKILEHRGVVVLEADSEPIHIRSHKEAPAAESEQPIEELEPQTETDDSFLFDAVEIDELNELLSEELSTSAEPLTATEQSEISGEEEDRLDTDEEEEFFENEESSEILSEDEDKEEPDDLDAGSKRDGKRKSLGEKNEIGIQDRKRKEKPQMSMFDLLNDKPKKSRENKIVDYCLKEEHSDYKLDYYDAYQKNLPVSGFVSLFKRHYGEYSGHSDGEKSITNTTKGKTIEWRDKENPENNLTVHLKWPEVAVRIAELIENDAYLTAGEKKEYARIVRFRKEREGAKTDAERCRVIADQIVEYGTQKAYGETYSEYPHFLEESIKLYLDHKQEVNRYLSGHKEVKSIGEQRDMFDDVLKVSFHIKYCPHWQEILRRRLAREHRVQDFADRFIRDCADNYIAETDGNRIAWTVEREELSERDYLFIKDNRDEFTEYLQNKTGVENAEFSMQRIEIVFDRGYIAGIASGNYPPPAEYTRLVREIADKIVSDGTKNTTEGNWVHYFDEFGEDETFARENAEEIAAELERHQEVSDVELTPDAFDTNFYLDYCPNYIPHKDEDGYEEEPKAAETEQTPIKPFNRFTELSAEDKAYFDEYKRKPHREPRESPWNTVQDCTVIAPGIYSVSTAGHGGILIDRALAPHILSSEALSEGFVENGCYCYEEDAAENIPLRELYDKRILDRSNIYFRERSVQSDRADARNGYILFKELTEAEKGEYLTEWNGWINESLAYWYPEYWAAYEQSCRSETEWQVRRFVDLMVEEGIRETHNGDFSFAYNHYTEEAEQFAREHGREIAEELTLRKEVQTVGLNDDGIDVKFHREYCSCLDDISLSESKNKEGEQGENTDLNAVLDQSELGGAKSRFKGNTDAIRLMNKLYFENREATDTERKVLAKYVGWGGLAQAFDETNKQWSKEYAELKDLLTTEQYEKAKGSVLNAHYTSKEVIGGIYAALERFGVKGNNRILEPAMGTGNFFGYMPQEISDGAKLYGVELDEVTGKIAAKLYPQAKVQIKGFEDTSFPQDYFDIVIGNVPFGGYSIYDSEYSRHKFMIHDYFIAKSIDRVKPNGIVAVVTSKGTMDKLNPVARKYMAERAELLGAIRLPNNAFKQTANTEAVTDILFFQKREERINDTSDIEWLGTGKTEDGFEVNNYFIRHPEMVLGTFAKETGLYGAEGLTVKPDGRDLGEALAAAVNNLPQNIYENPEQVPIDTEETESTDVFNIRPMCYIAMNGKVYMRVGETLVEQEIPAFPKDAYERIAGMIDLRNELRHVLDIQAEGCTDEALNRAQWKLNADYDRFVRKYGIINGQTNTRLFREDGDAALLFACEVLSEDKTKATKADIFTKRTIRPYSVPTHTNDTLEALQICRNERGGVDLSYIEELTGKDFDTVLSELGDTVYRDPASVKEGNKYSGYQTAEDYLSGKVVEKLRIAQEYSKQDESYLRNVTALEKVQPEPLKADEISVRIGASWVKPEYYRQFLMELLDIYRFYKDGLQVRYNAFDSSWKVERADHVRKNAGMNATEIYGTNRANAFRLFEDCLNQRATSIHDTVLEDGREKQVLNQAETIAAREKQNKIKEAFADWIYAEPKRREDLEITYNSLFNQIRLPSYDGSYLKFPGMNPAIELRPHQKNAVARIAGTGNSTLLHHVVGSGKSYTMSASAMKLRQYGLAKKPMIVVPNHLVQQMANEFRTLYPTAKLLIANKEDLEKNKRKQFVSKVAMGDWDSVIIAQSSFAKIPVSHERQERMMREEIAKIEAAILEMREESGTRTAVKNLERIKKGREAMLKKLLDSGKKDDVLIFENLGVDYLFVDEADAYKNRFLYTKMNNVSGISNAASARASDMQLKIEYINELHGGDKGVVFATGTPISNSMAEMYVMQSYLQKNTLEELGIDYFDGWAADFGETVTALEMSPSGQGYRARTRFAKFTNLPELMTLYRSFADVQTADMVKLDVPEAERITVTLEPSEQTVQIAEEIAKRAEAIYNGGVDPHIDNMLKVTSDGKKLALDVRCFDQFLKDEGTGKLDICADNAAKVYEETNAIRGTQLIFCDMATPKKPYEEYEYGKDFDVYNDLKHKLIERGIPKEEIAFIHDAKTDKEKQALFDKMNEGRSRILIGSTEKCGAGTNVQKRLAALHHLDAPYRPRDLQQRDGRGIRQHNMNKSVKIFTYVKKRTLDSYCYQILENKQRFISQIENGSLTVREAEDIDETTLSYAEIKAITAANPKIKRKVELETELTRLRVLEGQYRKNLYALQDKTVKDLPTQIHAQEQLLQYVQEDEANMRGKYNPDVFSINVLGKIYTDKKEGAAALVEALRSNKYDTPVAEYGGFRISLNPPTVLTDTRSVSLTHHGSYGMEIGDSALGLITRLDNFMSDFHEKKGRFNAKLEQLKRDLAVAEAELKKPFEHKGKIEEIMKELSEINAELDLNKHEEVVIDTDEENDNEEVNYMALPEKETEKTEPAKRPHKRMTEKQYKLYADYTAKFPDTVIFLKNGDFYETVGDEADIAANVYGAETYEKELGGEKRIIAMLTYDTLDAMVNAFAEKDRQFKIVESENEIDREVDFLETEAESKAIAATEEQKNADAEANSEEKQQAHYSIVKKNEDIRYYGKDTENTSYAYMSGELNAESFAKIAEKGAGADNFVIAADSVAFDEYGLKSRGIFYLEYGNEIQESDLSDEDTVIGKMQTIVDKLTTERARESMDLYQRIRDSVLEEYAEFEKGSEEELPYKQRFYTAVKEYFEKGGVNLLDENDMKALEKDKGNILARLYDYDWDGVSHDLSDDAEITVLVEYYNENKVSENAGTEDKDCAKIVRVRVTRFYEKYKQDNPDYANNLGRNLFYRDMSDYLQETDTLPYAYYIALEKDGDEVLSRLCEFYEQNIDLYLYTYRDRQEIVEQYVKKYYLEILQQEEKPKYFGKGADGAAYYFLPQGLSYDALAEIKVNASEYIIAAPKSMLSRDKAKEYHITFLKTERDLPDAMLYGTAATAKYAMRGTAGKTKHEAENIEQVTENAQTALENLQSDPSTERAGYKERFFAAFAEFIENADDYYLSAEDIAELVKDGDAVTERVYSYYMDTIDQINIDDWSEFTELTKNYIDERGRIYEMTKEPIDHGDWKTAQGKDVRSYNASLRASIECRYAIEEAIRNNFDGRHLNKDFENGLIEQFGMERVTYVLANTVQELEYDGRFSRDTKAWANSITVTERSDHRNRFVVSSHSAVLDGFIERVRKAEKMEEQKKEKGGTMQEEKYRKETLKGLPVVQIERDKYGHDIAIVKRKEDFVVAIGYNLKDGTWAQGRYDFSTQESAQEFIDKNYKPNTEEKGQEKKWLTAKVSRDALIRRYDRHSFFRMPNGEYEDYTYNVFNSRIKESRQLVELESDGHELCYEIVIPANEEVVVKNRDGDEIIFTAEEFTNLIGRTANKDYERKENDGNTNWFAISLPQEALRGSYEKSSLFVMPLKSEFTGYSYYIPNVFIEEDKREENGNILITLPEDFKVTIKNKATDEELVITVFDLFNECNATQGEDYARVKSEHQTDAEEKRQIITVIPANAKIARYENQTLFKMPEKGEYAGYCFYLFNDKLSDADDKIQVKLSEDFTVYLNDKKNDRTAELTAAELKAIMDGATAEDFIRTFGKNEELFKEQEELLRKNVPQGMLERPNWVIVRTRKNEEKNKTDKFLISPVTGKFAEIDEPETWTDFETACKYARENGGVTLAYALDGKDKICCIDMDKCLDGYGKISETGAKVRRASGKTYSEISVSGNGMHVFGKMDDMDLRVYSNDGTLEFYQKSHFITMTGNSFGNRELLNFNELPIKSLLEEKCKKRSEYLNAGKGIEGLSSMTDREVIEKACAAKHGETFKALYNGQDIKNNHSNSDMALMTRLAFWCNGDKDQMLRIFATSGLYRPNKSPEYYEYTAMKAVKENAERYTPKSTADKFDSPNRAKKAEGNSK